MYKRGRQQCRRFKFNTKKQMDNFIKMYSDLFIPYADSSIEIGKHACFDGTNMYKGYIVGNCIFDPIYRDPLCIEVLMEPEGFKEVLSSNLFEKKPLKPKVSRQYYYEYKESN